MNKIIPILVVGILVLSGLGVTAITSNKATTDNHPPDIPKVAGVTQPKIGELYDYTFWTTDPDGDDVSYYVDWGDDNNTGWIGPVASGEPVVMVHAWYESGSYLLRCKAKDHPWEAESDWCGLIIKVPPKNKALNKESSSIPNSQNVMSIIPSIENTVFFDDTTPPVIEVTWRTYKVDGKWYVEFDCEVYDEESDIDRVEMWIDDGIHETITGSGPDVYIFTIEWSKALKTSVFKFVAYNGAGLSAFVTVDGSDIKSCSISQQSTMGTSSQNSGLGITEIPNNNEILGNRPPDAPEITGPEAIPPGTYEYTFNATDPDGDNVSYLIHWGDANSEETAFHASGEEVAVSHTYSRMGAYTITAKAKDIHGAMGPEGTNPVEVLRSRHMVNPLILRLLERFIERFPLLEKLLNIRE